MLLAAMALVGASSGEGEAAGLPLPPAPVRVLIPDVTAFDAALTGAYRQAFLGEEFQHRVTNRPEQLFGHLDHGSPGAVDIAVCRQTNRQAADATPNLHTDDHE